MSLIALRKNTGEAIYSQIAGLLREEISRFRSPGECLPSEKDLAARFAVNRHTVRRAIEGLMAAGILERRHGKGTYVLEAPADFVIARGTRFTEAFESLGKAAATRVQSKQVVPARNGIADRLKVAESTPVLWIESLRLADGRPVCVTSHFLPQAKFPGLLELYNGGSLHALVMASFGVSPRRTESLVSAMLPQGDDAVLLEMARNQPVLRVKSVNVDDSSSIPFEYSLTRFRADRIQLRFNP
jgi:GntR family phosphonate transport system transcriptional regulator